MLSLAKESRTPLALNLSLLEAAKSMLMLYPKEFRSVGERVNPEVSSPPDFQIAEARD